MNEIPSPFQITTEMGVKMAEDEKKAREEGERITPFGMRRIEPAPFRAEMEKGGPTVRKATIARLVKEKGGLRQGLKEYRRMLEGK